MTRRDDSSGDPLDQSIEEVGARLRSGEITCEALTAAALARAQATQPSLNADAALAQARERDREAAAGRWRGPLHGIPLAHKDCFERIGSTMTVGSKVIARTGERTSTTLSRLDDAGAIDLGTLNMSEMVAGPTGQNPHFGDCCNSWDPSRISGGSSSGSGAAVGAGTIFGSLGSDTGGSIRLPASVNGLFGLKPTYGRVSRDGCFPRAYSLDCVGPLARSAGDCARILQAIAGVDVRDPSSLSVPVPDYARLLESADAGSRIAVLDVDLDLHPDVARAFARLTEASGERYRVHGGSGGVPHVRFDELSLCFTFADIFSKVEAATLHGDWMRATPHAYSQAVYSRTEPGLHVPAVRYVEALNMRARVLDAWLRGPMADADVLLCPTIPVPVPTRIDADMEKPGAVFDVVASLTTLTRPFNYLGVPVLNMPIGVDANGLPVGAQLVGRPFGEARLLAVAQRLASDLEWHAPPSTRIGTYALEKEEA